MERPFFSLSKRKRLKPIDYRSPDGKVSGETLAARRSTGWRLSGMPTY